MAGLMEKEFRILMQRRQSLLIFVVIAVFLSVMQGGAFIVGYLPFISVTLAVSTISYDEFDNGYPFLLTLPITRKSYVVEKYLFGLLTILCAWIPAVVLCCIIDGAKGVGTPVSETIFMSVAMLLVPVILMNLMIPLQLKYGSERSRVVILAVMGILAIAIYAVVKLVQAIGMNTTAVWADIEQISNEMIVLVFVAAGILATLISMMISNRIMENKQL